MNAELSLPRQSAPIKTDGRYVSRLRRPWLLLRLSEADGITYDELCRAVVEAFPHARNEFRARARGVRAVRDLLWDELAVTEPDESVWLTPDGWHALQRHSAHDAGQVA